MNIEVEGISWWIEFDQPDYGKDNTVAYLMKVLGIFQCSLMHLYTNTILKIFVTHFLDFTLWLVFFECGWLINLNLIHFSDISTPHRVDLILQYALN